MILQATKALIDLIQHKRHSYAFARAYALAIARFGSAEDARALFAAFLEDPARGDLILSFLFTPIRLLGDHQLAHEMFLQCVSHDRLHAEMREEILLCFGFLGYLPAEPLLWRYATQKGNYQHGQMACLGLAHLPCNGLQAEIESTLHADFGKNFWDSEFLPILASKTGNMDWLSAFYEWGSTHASTDCNGGLVLGLALYGEAGRTFFQNVLWNPSWEAHAFATGTAYHTYLGCRALGISPLDLAAQLQKQIQQGCSQSQVLHGFHLLQAILECFIEDDLQPNPTLKFLPRPLVSAQQVYSGLFHWSDPNHDDSILNLLDTQIDQGSSTQHTLKHAFQDGEQRLLIRIEREIERHQIPILW